MMEMAKSEVLHILRRAGFDHVIARLEPVLPDPVDLNRDEPLLASHGITRGMLEDALGGSP
jgi:hypothetical protein